jgi:membrane-anchored mycosin MYCP
VAPVRVAAVTLLAAVSQCAAPPPAYAVSPPPIDNTLLPAAAAPAPPQPTVQRQVCTVPAFDPRPAGTPTQLDGLDLQAVRALTRGSGQRVAVIGTGVSPHRRLPRLIGGGDYVSSADGTRDCDGNGTVIAGIIAAAPSPDDDAFSGVAPEATVIGIRQSSTTFGTIDDPSQTGVGDVDTLAQAVRTAADLDASVIDVSSLACVPVESELDDRALGAALAYAVDMKNAVVVTAAGDTGDAGNCPAPNDETGVAVSPAWYDDYVLTVGSVDADGVPSAFSLPGPWVDVAAPGEAVLSVSPIGDAMANTVGGPHGSTPIVGTGYAAAVVSGLAALIRSRFPGWTPRQVMDRIKATAHHPPGGRDGVVGSGVVDPLAAVSTGAPSAADAPGPGAVAARVIPPQAPTQTPEPAAEPAGRRIALTGAAALLGLLVVTLAGRTATRRRLARPVSRGAADHHVPGD